MARPVRVSRTEQLQDNHNGTPGENSGRSARARFRPSSAPADYRRQPEVGIKRLPLTVQRVKVSRVAGSQARRTKLAELIRRIGFSGTSVQFRLSVLDTGRSTTSCTTTTLREPYLSCYGKKHNFGRETSDRRRIQRFRRAPFQPRAGRAEDAASWSSRSCWNSIVQEEQTRRRSAEYLSGISPPTRPSFRR